MAEARNLELGEIAATVGKLVIASATNVPKLISPMAQQIRLTVAESPLGSHRENRLPPFFHVAAERISY